MTKLRRWLVPGLAALATAAVPACTDDATAIRIKLVTDPEINTEEQVLSVVDRIELVLDVAGGFSSASDDLELIDRDADGEPELVFGDDVVDRRSFPLYRLRRGSLGTQPLQVSARGLVGGQLAALGDAVSAVFEDQVSSEVSVPLNLRAKYRPPRVVATLPQHGQQSVPPALGFVHVVFSKWIDPGSLAGNLALTFQGQGPAQPVEGQWELINTNVLERSLPEERTLATLRLGSCALSPGTYSIAARTAITDTAGVPLDQRPPAPGRHPFAATFTLPGTPGSSPCSSGQPGCQSNSECDPATPPAYVCARGDDGIGRCIPTPPSCDGVITCPAGYRCVEADGAVTCVKEAKVCVADADCDTAVPPRYVCSTEEPLAGQCIPAPLTCETANPCPDGWRCEGGQDGKPIFCVEDKPAVDCVTDPELCAVGSYCDKATRKCVPCQVYPSEGCTITCTKEKPDCPPPAVCDFDKSVCRS